MKKLLLLLAPLALAACDTTGTSPVGSIPGGTAVCAQIKSDKFDLALKAYGAAVDAVNLLIDAKVVVPGTPRALAIANANDKVLAAFAVAESARGACNASTYASALASVSAGIVELRSALKGGQ